MKTKNTTLELVKARKTSFLRYLNEVDESRPITLLRANAAYSRLVEASQRLSSENPFFKALRAPAGYTAAELKKADERARNLNPYTLGGF